MSVRELVPDVRRLAADEVEALHASMPASGRILDGVLTHYHAVRFQEQESGAGDYLVAWIGDEAVGHTLIRWNGSMVGFLNDRGVTDPWVEGLAVKRGLWSRGIGTAVMLAAERATRERGFRVIGLAVGVENERARALYERLGYRETGLGVFDVTWSYVDAAGIEHPEGETCNYWIKDID
jgi:ribosomal protein S18 acetylase RimI-like enzyme